MSDLLAGIYRHYKGPLYLVLGLAHDANAEDLAVPRPQGLPGEWDVLNERTVVVYIGLQLDGAHLGPRLAVRTLEDFARPVCWTSECEGFGKTTMSAGWQATHCRGCMEALRPRFTYVGPEYTEEMR